MSQLYFSYQAATGPVRYPYEFFRLVGKKFLCRTKNTGPTGTAIVMEDKKSSRFEFVVKVFQAGLSWLVKVSIKVYQGESCSRVHPMGRFRKMTLEIINIIFGSDKFFYLLNRGVRISPWDYIFFGLAVSLVKTSKGIEQI